MSDKKESKTDKESRLSDTLKKIISVGAGAAFMTEDAVKGILTDLPISKEIVASLLQSAKSSKEEFVDSIREEIQKYLKNVDSKVLIDSILERYDVELNATFRFKKKEGISDKPERKKRTDKK